MLGEKKKDHVALLNEGEENEMEIYGYRMSVIWIALCIVGYILSGGILLLLFYWKPEWSVWANCSPCSLKKANVILLRETDGAKKYTRKKVRWIQLSSLAKSLKGKPVESIITDESFLIHKATTKPAMKVKYIRVQKIRYVWDNTSDQFKKIGTLEEEHSCFAIHSKFGSGLTKEEGDIRRLVCGPNTIEVEIAPLWKLFFKEVINLFYIYQFFTVGLWLSQGYLGYSIAIIFLCTVTITLSLYELRQQSVKLHKLVEAHNNVKVTVCRRDGEYSELESRHLVPGDVIILKGEKFFLSCDAILINGVCILNEGMLTGECIPVTKTSLPSLDKILPWKEYSGEDYKRHVLFCGTEVVRTEASAQGPVRAVVLQTGFNTTKGDMVRSILYPKPVHFKLHRDVKRFFMFLAFLALVGIIYSTVIFAMRGMPAGRIIIEALVLVTSAICPIIPAALTVGILYAQSRLKKESIYSISPHRINMCGQINLICFDKTGTLTEDGLDLLGIIPSEGNCFQKMYKFTSGNSLPWGPLYGALVSCHSLLILDGELQGDPLDLKMFEATNWEIEDSKVDNSGDLSEGMVLKPGPNAIVDSVKGIVILNQYPFSSSLQRMAVITQAIGDEKLVVYMKGAPEMVAKFCKPVTIPNDFSSQLELYTFQGFRVIGLAYKAIEPGQHNGVDSLTRENVESELEFLGFLILENRLKPETVGILKELNSANIRIVMLTGDNIQTAATVAKTSGMIPENSKVVLVEANEPQGLTPASISWRLMEYREKIAPAFNDTYIDVDVGKVKYHFALSGKSYEVVQKYFPSYLPKILMNGTVFARVSPLQKATLIEDYRSLDYYVGMCGDGANDCAALKTAHAGISLSEQEASVAAPFNSSITNISCVSDLLKEGRAALVTSFCMFKYMSLFGIIEYNNTLLLYWQRNIFGNNQFLVHDFAVMFVIFLTMSSTHAYPKLAPYRPPGQLISPPMLLSVIFNICFSVAMETYAFLVVQQQPWYSDTDLNSGCPRNNSNIASNTTSDSHSHGPGIAHPSYTSSTLWLITANHFVIIAFVFSKGKPFRQPVYKNYIFVGALLVEVAFTMFLIFADIEGLYVALELVCTPTLWRVHMLIILVVCFVILFFVEDVILDNRALWIALKSYFQLQPSSQYKKLLNALELDPEWPPLNQTIYETQASDGPESKLQAFSNLAFEKNEK